MTPNSENGMARFLMAILNQKNLKDVSKSNYEHPHEYIPNILLRSTGMQSPQTRYSYSPLQMDMPQGCDILASVTLSGATSHRRELVLKTRVE